MKIKVKNLLPNPFRNIDAYPIDQEKIRQLRNSIRETSFWDNILVRPAPKNGKFEIAYGHHRLVAIKEELGEKTVVDIPVRNLSDEAMLRIMANENMREWGTDWRVTVETVKETKRFLEKRPEIVIELGFYRNKKHPFKGEVGANVITKFLGKNWSEIRVSSALTVMRDKEVQTAYLKISGEKRQNIQTLKTITYIQDKKAKKEWLNEIPRGDFSQAEVLEIARFENEPALTEQDKETIRTLIQKGEIRGKEQIKRAYDLYKAQRLTIPRMRRETEDARKWIQDRLEEIAEDAKHLGRLITAMGDRIAQNPEVIGLLPEEQMLEASQAIQELYSALTNFRNTYQAAKKKLEKSKPSGQIEEIKIGKINSD